MDSVAVENGTLINGEVGSTGAKPRVFEKVENVSELEPILKERLPISANIFNILKSQANWPDITWYVFGGEVSSRSWILSAYQRDDFGLEISVSRPQDSPATTEIREAFSNASFIDWSERFMFPCTDEVVSGMIKDISVREKGNYTHFYPCYLYYMDSEDVNKLEDKFNFGEGVEMKPMDNPEGEKFLVDTYKYARKGFEKYVNKILTRNLSVGIYVDGKLESGVTIISHGLLGLLYTLSGNRGKGYAKAAMNTIIKKSAEIGLFPSCTVEVRNEPSKAFQTKIGFKLACCLYYIRYEKPEF